MVWLSSTEKFELAIKSRTQDNYYTLQLYIAGCSLHSQRAITNLRRLCQEHNEINYRLEVIDILQQPELAKQNQIIAVPTLIKKEPVPVRIFIGDLSDTGAIMAQLTE